MLPDSMADSKAYGVEIDSISGRIAQQLYQNSSIAVNGFEKVQMPDSFFDVAIGNVPFGDFKVRDKKYDKNHWLIHDYFFGKTLDKVRPGGVIAFITSKGTMDKENSAVRKYLAQRADLIGAIRLPNNAFKANAGTEVTSDIIFLQKRDRMTDIEPDWVHLDTDENGIRMNRYFVQHPEMILGDMVMESTRFGMDSTCRAYEDADLSELLSEAVQNLHAQITDYEVEELDEEEDRSIPADPAVRNFSSDNDFAPFLNIMNEFYAKDTSNKIKAVFDARMKDGKRCSGSIPYGYNRLPSDKQTLVVDPVASEVVKRIFTLANDGKSTRAIAEILTEEKVLTPAAYAKEYHPEQYNGNKFTNPYLWAMSTIRNILDRQEYLGHTVLRKSVSTNFKLHKRKSTDEEEQYVFPNTHEPIISQELWDSVQKRRSRVNRASAWGTHSNRLSGYLYCADCGRRMTLQTHYSKKDGSVQYSYRCGGYASRVNSCTSHSISTDNVEALILSSVKRFSRFVLNDEQAFALELQSLWKDKQEVKPKHNQSELQRCQ